MDVGRFNRGSNPVVRLVRDLENLGGSVSSGRVHLGRIMVGNRASGQRGKKRGTFRSTTLRNAISLSKAGVAQW